MAIKLHFQVQLWLLQSVLGHNLTDDSVAYYKWLSRCYNRRLVRLHGRRYRIK